MPNDNIIHFQDVNFSYNGVSILEDVTFSIKTNDFVCLVGPNGGGKTTILKLILGIIKPVSGKITVFGNSPEKARSRIGYMPQHLHHDPQFPVTVMDIVLMGRMGHKGISGLFGWHSKKDHQAAEKALGEIGMRELADRPFEDLSGGQQQRALVARALATEPELLLLDEPTSNVDTQTQEDFFTILNGLNKKMTILLVSHDIGFVSKMVRSVLCVNQRVIIHPTSNITGEMIEEIYSCSLRMVRHDHRCSEGGHSHD